MNSVQGTGEQIWVTGIRLAHERLGQFVLRRGPEHDARLAIVGRAYVEQRMSIDGAGKLLGFSRPDLVALERLGYARPPEALGLPADERAARLLAAREDRLARQGLAATEEPGEVAREVVATQRIEGIDARRWIRSKP